VGHRTAAGLDSLQGFQDHQDHQDHQDLPEGAVADQTGLVEGHHIGLEGVVRHIAVEEVRHTDPGVGLRTGPGEVGRRIAAEEVRRTGLEEELRIVPGGLLRIQQGDD